MKTSRAGGHSGSQLFPVEWCDAAKTTHPAPTLHEVMDLSTSCAAYRCDRFGQQAMERSVDLGPHRHGNQLRRARTVTALGDVAGAAVHYSDARLLARGVRAGLAPHESTSRPRLWTPRGHGDGGDVGRTRSGRPVLDHHTSSKPVRDSRQQRGLSLLVRRRLRIYQLRYGPRLRCRAECGHWDRIGRRSGRFGCRRRSQIGRRHCRVKRCAGNRGRIN